MSDTPEEIYAESILGEAVSESDVESHEEPEQETGSLAEIGTESDSAAEETDEALVEEAVNDDSGESVSAVAEGNEDAASGAEVDNSAAATEAADVDVDVTAENESIAESESTKEQDDQSSKQPLEPLSRDKLRRILEGVLLAAAAPMNEKQLQQLFDEGQRPAKDEIQAIMDDIASDLKGRGFEIQRVASGWRYQVCQDLSPWVSRLWEEKPQKYTRATLETLSLIAYRQPITRGDIEDIRGVAVSSNIIRSLLERNWVRVVGHRDVPGRPAMYATTKEFLDYFNLSSLDELPTLSEIRDLDSINEELQLGEQKELPMAVPDEPSSDEPVDGEVPAPSATAVVDAEADAAPASDCSESDIAESEQFALIEAGEELASENLGLDDALPDFAASDALLSTDSADLDTAAELQQGFDQEGLEDTEAGIVSADVVADVIEDDAGVDVEVVDDDTEISNIDVNVDDGVDGESTLDESAEHSVDES